MVIGLIAIFIFSIIGLVLLIKHILFVRDFLWQFKHCNVIIYGKKGTGKDLVTNFVINRRKEPYYSNISYSENKDDGLYTEIKLKDVSCMPNTYESFVNDNLVQTEHKLYEGANIYISDIGVFLPSYMDNKLYVKFPSMPIFYALSRHLYDTNVHCNTQNLERAWKALREQADFYVRVRRTYKIFGWFFTKVYTYENYESAKKNLMPIKTRFFNKYSKAEVDLYIAQNGEIKSGFIIQRKKNIHYNTRYFETKLLLGERKYFEKKKEIDTEVCVNDANDSSCEP